MRPTIEVYALVLARAARTRSEDPYLAVGCCILRQDGSVASLGYNGAPSGIELDWSDRDQRRARVIHAEVNALRFVRPGEGWLLASTNLPCLDCLRAIRSYGILAVIFEEGLSTMYDEREIKAVAEEFGMSLEQGSATGWG